MTRLGEHWQRPKRMHQTTHSRLLAIIWECEERRDAALAGYLAEMMQRPRYLGHDPLFRQA